MLISQILKFILLPSLTMVAHENCYRFIDAVWPSYIQFNVYCVLSKAQCNISGFQKHIQTFI